MSVDFYDCTICGEIANDCGFMTHCGGCEGLIMHEDCESEQKKKYGTMIDEYDERVLKACDSCSPKNRSVRVAELTAQLEKEGAAGPMLLKKVIKKKKIDTRGIKADMVWLGKPLKGYTAISDKFFDALRDALDDD